MKILVTGGAGFIGSHITDLFIEGGHQVVVVDNLVSGEKRNVHPQAAYYQLDILDWDRLKALGEKEKPDVICHQAALVNLRASFDKPLEYAQVNVVGSLNLLELARALHVKKFIYASSGGAIYGEPVNLPVDEDHPTQPLDLYGVSKLVVENYMPLYAAHFGVSYTALRYANVYGPRQNPHGENGVIAIFADLMAKGKPSVVINGTGEQMRDFVYVQDVARANWLALDRGENQGVNISSGQGTSINAIYDALHQMTGYQGKAIHDPPKRGEVFKIWLSNAKAKAELGWTPHTDFQEGLRRTISFFAERSKPNSRRE